MNSIIYNYLSGIQTKGMYARREDKEKALSYAEKAAIAKVEEEKQIKEIEKQLQSQYNGNNVKYTNINLLKTYLHYKFGGGRPMYVDITGEYIPTISAKKHFNNEIGKEADVNTFDFRHLSNIGVTIGSARWKYLGNNTVEVVGNDTYDFNLDDFKINQRNIGTIIGSILHNSPLNIVPFASVLTYGGRPFKIYIKGKAKINS